MKAGATWRRRAGLAALLLAGCDRHAAPPPSGPAVFADVTRAAGLDFTHQLANGRLDNIMKSDGAGGAILDYDGDGFMDLYLVNSGPVPGLSDAPPGTPRRPNRLFRNRGDGTLEDVTERAGVEGRGFGTTAAAADYDNDGRTDLLVVNFGGLILYRNLGDGTFAEVTDRAGLASTDAGISATFLDYDGDGWLDLFVANYLVFDPALKPPPGASVPYPGPLSYEPQCNRLYRNRGDGTFEDVSERTGVRLAGHRAMAVTPLDYDGDGDQDLYVANDGTPNLLLANDGRGRFTETALPAGVAFNQFGQAEGSMGAVVADVNADGRPDLFVTRFGQASLYVSGVGGLFDDRVAVAGILNVTASTVGWGSAFLDYDNDGDSDLFVANGDPHYLKGTPSVLLENQGEGSFADATGKGGSFFRQKENLRGCGALDLDNDGRIDLVLTRLGGPAVLLHNHLPSRGHWLTLKLTGRRGNRDGFGAKVRVVAGTRSWQAEARCPTSYVFQQDPRLHFGLGDAARVDRIEVRWPGGQLQVIEQPPFDRVLPIAEP